eukprot:g28605.t1
MAELPAAPDRPAHRKKCLMTFDKNKTLMSDTFDILTACQNKEQTDVAAASPFKRLLIIGWETLTGKGIALAKVIRHSDWVKTFDELLFISGGLHNYWHLLLADPLHLRRHTGEEPYACNQCKRKFVTRSSLMFTGALCIRARSVKHATSVTKSSQPHRTQVPCPHEDEAFPL